MWAPQDYLSRDYFFGQDERVFTFETYRRWLQKSFFRRTGEYDGVTWLNRHMFAHGTHSDWQQSANFSRLVVALATLALIELWHDEFHLVSFFFPEMNDDSKLLWQQALLQADAQMKLKMIEQKRDRRACESRASAFHQVPANRIAADEPVKRNDREACSYRRLGTTKRAVAFVGSINQLLS